MKQTLSLFFAFSLFHLFAFSQSVIFPQEQQAGVATSSVVGATYTLGNDLLSASFVLSDGKLTFGGCEAMGLKPSEDLFSIRLGNGTEVKSSAMTLKGVEAEDLFPDASAAKGSLKLPGKSIKATYTQGNLTLTWRAVLRDGSHYLRTELELTAKANVAMNAVIPMHYTVDNSSGEQAPAVVGNTRGAVIASDKIFAGLETPMGKNSIVGAMDTAPFVFDSWTSTSFDWTPGSETPQGILNLGLPVSGICGKQGYLGILEGGRQTVTFQYTSGRHRLDIAGVDILDLAGNVVASDYHKGYTGGQKSRNVYTLNIPESGYYLVRYFRDTVTDGITTAFDSNGTITWSCEVTAPELVYDGNTEANVLPSEFLHLAAPTETEIIGEWSRQTTLAKGKTWKIGTVVGLIAPKQARRSFLCYSERERAVPWRAFPMYNSWFELNINRNDDENYTTNFNESQCLEVLDQWKRHLFDKYGVGIGSFVWDDGWDEYGTWQFNPNFPDGFQNLSDKAWSMDSQIGAWLGPVGGYGQSGNYRRSYWSSRGGMQLSNSAYYNVFLERTSFMLNNYHFNYFKFDGISAQFSAVGPDSGATGEENAEGIIDIEQKLREVKPDVFLNTTVGTWASPFWFQVTDAVWRQENDWSTVGNQGNTREQWITYRDRLVYQNFVQNSPLCPINTLMTHGFILSKYGGGVANMSKNYNDIVREMRCAFACGSGMVEVYADFSLMNSINGGKLWGDLAECIKWQKAQEDVLPDVHWVGGNPWDGSKANVYGWAAWNGERATLALRNPAASAQIFTTTLREALDIPDYIHTSITLSKAFTQSNLNGLTVGVPIDIDTPLTLRLAASSVYIYNGIDENPTGISNYSESSENSDYSDYSESCYDLLGRKLSNSKSHGIRVVGGRKVLTPGR
ncbi:MAG: hypothetical protein IKQ37_03635 [Bacteroidaceae bacterium]|nr:hypothetical protein [Bacteroidaceae bacterium]